MSTIDDVIRAARAIVAHELTTHECDHGELIADLAAALVALDGDKPTQKEPYCRHIGIGKPGCEFCDPRPQAKRFTNSP